MGDGINYNLFFTLLASSTTLFLGALVYFHDRKSDTNKIFLILSLVGSIWAVLNYFSVIAPFETALFWIKGVIFLAVPHMFLFYLFVFNFPSDRLMMDRGSFRIFLGLMILMMILAISPWIFSGVKTLGNKIIPVPGILIPIFGTILVAVFLTTVTLVIKRYIKASELFKKQWQYIAVGFLIAYTLLVSLVFLRVILDEDTTFVPYSPLFILPIFFGSAYAILRYQLFHVKVITAEILTFGLLITSLIQIISATTTATYIASASVSVFSLIFGILLIQSILKEVHQRERLQVLTEQLRVTNQELKDLSHFKTQLLSLVSHQIKTPIIVIRDYASSLLEGLFGKISPKNVEPVRQMHLAADSLLNMITTFLDFRKIEEGRMEYNFEKTEIVKIVKEIFEELKTLTRTKKLEFTFEPKVAEIWVKADPPKIRQVFQNLIDNAIKYTFKGFVKVGLYEEGDAMVLTVSDSGIGISPVLLPLVFEEFIRDERIKKEVKGTGLGLFIARKIIEAHDGEIWAESAGENKGSKFVVKMKKLKDD